MTRLAVVLLFAAGCHPCDRDALQQRWAALRKPATPSDALGLLAETCADTPAPSDWAPALLEHCPGVDPAVLSDAGTRTSRDAVYAHCGGDALGSASVFRDALGEPILAALVHGWLLDQGIAPQLSAEIALAVRGPAALHTDTPLAATLPDSPPPSGTTSAGGPRLAVQPSTTFAEAWGRAEAHGTTHWIGRDEAADRLGELTLQHTDEDGLGAPGDLRLWRGEQTWTAYRDGRRVPLPRALDAGLPDRIILAAEPGVPLADLFEPLATLQARAPEARERLWLAAPGPAPPPVQLVTSAAMLDVLTPIQHPRYEGFAVDEVFEKMRPLGDRYCRMRVGMERTDPAAIEAFVSGALLAEPRNPLSGLKAGCWNFFRMNDQKPSQDFALLKALRPDDDFDCYSVGLLQPLMMHNEMGCRTLTMIDFDWRILDAHSSLLGLYGDGALGDGADLDDALSGIQLGWFAKAAEAIPAVPARLSLLCNGSARRGCAAHLRQFQQTWTTLEGIQLNLSALHDGSWLDSGDTRVIFLSNAGEPFYTSAAQFEQLVQRLAASLAAGQRAYLIHHTGGSTEAGVYEVTRTDGGHAVSLVCRDTYHQTAAWEPGLSLSALPTYDLWIDGVASGRDSAPTCRALRKRLLSP